MIMTGVIVNTLGIVAGGVIGSLLGNRIPERIRNIVMTASAIAVVYIGISGSLTGKNILVCILSLVIGVIIGELIDIDGKMNGLGSKLEERYFKKSKQFSKGFVSASVLFCTGAMAVVGSIESGINLNHEILISKGLIDGCIAIIMASTLSIGVAFSCVSVFMYQGALTVIASQLGNFLPEVTVNEMSCVGSIVILMIGLNLLGVTNIKVANFIPAAFIPIVLCMFM